ncbi:TetR/AcrR family transcriptional regulator [Paramaledivibacter caminithermalis]|uniref:Transcriptional regulator, TetR family n=1 Tax=Paramaledivibacter caminithermalis (strain DSM 15212 / CIP 107654 / DViRD3) TaxID=1121301 RepID=A0A1M6QVS8_PARC5|nr:TetR/AcrR family transcriptional regulator [Paramaledivibacter caminithermalis]SHK24223.1 transcriptional regulator, TetR family [Paramaledivibacter caminithermalis DSM 15212]
MREMAKNQETTEMNGKFHKKTFEKISEERRKKIFDVAISEFAANGYNGTNINVIVKKAGISIGSMYSYFASKEDLFLTIVDRAYQILENALKEVNIEDGDIFGMFEQLLRIAHNYATTYPEMNQIYLDITTQGLSSLSNRLSHKLEEITAKMYWDVIKKAKKRGFIDSNIDEHILSFCLDNLITMYQFSFTSDYYKERLKIFLGDDIANDNERVILGIVELIKKAISV